MTIAGMWFPDEVKSNVLKFIYFLYQFFAALLNTIIFACEITFIVQSIMSSLPIAEYNDTLFISITGYASLIKFWFTITINKKKVLHLKNLSCQNEFQALDDNENILEKKYEKFIR